MIKKRGRVTNTVSKFALGETTRSALFTYAFLSLYFNFLNRMSIQCQIWINMNSVGTVPEAVPIPPSVAYPGYPSLLPRAAAQPPLRHTHSTQFVGCPNLSTTAFTLVSKKRQFGCTAHYPRLKWNRIGGFQNSALAPQIKKKLKLNWECSKGGIMLRQDPVRSRKTK